MIKEEKMGEAGEGVVFTGGRGKAKVARKDLQGGEGSGLGIEKGDKASQSQSQVCGHRGDQQGTHIITYLVGLQCGVTQLVFMLSPWTSALLHLRGWILGIMENLQRKIRNSHEKSAMSITAQCRDTDTAHVG